MTPVSKSRLKHKRLPPSPSTTRLVGIDGNSKSPDRPNGSRSGGGTGEPSGKSPGGNLPVALSSFVGRTEERAEVAKLVRASRLVTLTGPGGVGKTRLAIRVGSDVAKAFPDGVALVELASVTDPTSVPAAAASALSVPKSSARGPLDRLIAYIKDRRVLLILDNCEHLIQACAEFTERLLQSCPNLKVLATSREALGIPGEHAWAVPAMPFPDPRDDSKLKRVMAYEAVRLFAERARQADKRFSLSPSNAPFVARICRHLDGVPLAIELAACRVGVLTPEQIAARLGDRFALLTTGDRAGMGRQQSLEGALQWSYELLSVPEQALFRRLSVFLGGFSLEAAERVCSDSQLPQSQVFDLLSGLVSKSLLIFDPTGLNPRYRTLETIRHYSRRLLAEHGEDEQLQRRHAVWCAELSEEAVEGGVGANPMDWVKRLEAEFENINSAFEWAIAHDDDLAIRLASATIWFWDVRRYFTEGIGWLQRAASNMQQVLSKMSTEPSPERARILWGTALLLNLSQSDVPIYPLLEESISIAKQVEDYGVAARALAMLGFNKVQLDHVSSGLPLLEESVKLARRSGDKWPLANVLGRLGRAYMFAGQPAKAQTCFEEFVEVARESRQSAFLCDGLYGAGWAALTRGNLGEAREFLTRALEAAGDMERYQASLITGALGELALATEAPDRLEQARRFFERGLVASRPLETSFPIVRCLNGLARVWLEQDDPQRARPLVEEAVSTARNSRAKNAVAPALQALAEVERTDGNLQTAQALLEEALAEARSRDEKIAVARSLCDLGSLVREQGDEDEAVIYLHESLSLYGTIGDRLSVAWCLDELAGLAAVQDRFGPAARMFAAADSIRRSVGAATPHLPRQRARLERDLALVRRQMKAAEFREAWDEGAAMSLAQVLTYAARGRGGRGRPRFGWASLTPVERQVVKLISQGLTNPEIADKLFVSKHTIRWHVSSIFSKLGISSRKELRQEAED